VEGFALSDFKRTMAAVVPGDYEAECTPHNLESYTPHSWKDKNLAKQKQGQQQPLSSSSGGASDKF
jgi:hypothetical protein